MNELPEGSAAALEPVRRALIADAQNRAQDLLAAAREQAQQRQDTARAEAAALLAAARATGEQSARVAAHAHTVRARRAARGLLLAAERELYDELSVRAGQAVTRLRADPDYPDVLRRLRAWVTAELGPGAEVVEHPGGGVLGSCEGRTIDLSLPAMASRELERLSGEVAALWASSPG